MNKKPHTKKWKLWMSNYMKNHPNSGQFKKGHKPTKKHLLKLKKILKLLHKLYPDKWKRSIKERKLMSLRMKEYIKKNPKFILKAIKAMQDKNKQRKYPKKTNQEKKRFKKFITKYYKTHKVWNKGLKTGLIPRTAFKKGKLHIGWLGGLGKEPYPEYFSTILKEFIRKRDHYKCQKCKIKQNKIKNYHKILDIHHIDYNKNNCSNNNLIALCHKCHVKTNSNRDYWYAYFMYILALNGLKE
jgi:hypothetical protein